MPCKLEKLTKRQLLQPPHFLQPESIQYETIMGSLAYGVSSDNSDMDMYAFCIPPKEYIFPHLAGHIVGFGPKPPGFEVYQQHHVFDKDAAGGEGISYDFQVYNIVNYFNLVVQGNPNMIDSLFTPERCITHITPIGQLVRDSRRMFLHKGCYHRYKGYAYQQLHKLRNKEPDSGKRRELIEKFGFDVKFAYHVVRLVLQCEQIMLEGDLDLERNREVLKSIRRGEWTLEEIEKYFKEKETQLDRLQIESKLQHSPDVSKVKTLLIECLDRWFGDVSSKVLQADPAIAAISKIEQALLEYRKSIQN